MSALAKLEQHPAGGAGVDERDKVPMGPRARGFVYQVNAGRREFCQRLCDVIDLEANVMHAWAATIKEANQRFVARGRDKLQGCVAFLRLQKAGVGFLVGHKFVRQGKQPQNRQGGAAFVQSGDGKRDVVDPFNLHWVAGLWGGTLARHGRRAAPDDI